MDLELGVHRGVKLVLLEGMSLNAAMKMVNVNFRTLHQYVQKYKTSTRYEIENLVLDKRGKKEYLNKVSLDALRLFGHAMDWNDFPISRITVIEKIRFLHQKERGLTSIDEVPYPAKATIKKIIKKTGIRLSSVRQGVSVDMLRSTKANVEYLGDWFCKLRDVRSKYSIIPKNIWNADEVGIQFSDFALQFWSTRACVRANMVNEHLTVMLTSNATGILCQPYLIFSGENSLVIPSVMLENEEAWSTFAPSGWMDVERFQVWMLKFIDEVKKRKNDQEYDDYVLLMVDGHNSRLNADTIFTAAVNRVVILVGPSQLTNAWQANDSGINKSFKENLKRLVAPHIEAKQQLSNSDIGIMILQAMKEGNMVRSILNSYRHVGVEPFDPLMMTKMIANEKPDEKSLEDPAVVLAVQMCKDHLEKLDNLVGEKRKREEKEKARKKEKKVGVSTSYATVLTNAETLASLQLGHEYTIILKLKARELHAEMIRMGWTFAELQQPQTNKFHTMKTLQKMVLDRLDAEHEKQRTKIDEKLKQDLAHVSPLSVDSNLVVLPVVQPQTTPTVRTAQTM